MSTDLIARLRQLLQPLNLAAFLAWLGLFVSLLGDDDSVAPGMWPTTVALMFAFLGAFVWSDLREVGSTKLDLRAVWLQVAIALAICACTRTTTSPVLLIVTLSQLAMILALRPLLVAAAAINLALYLVLVFVWRAQRPAVIVLIYTGFECFAAITAWYAKRSEQAATELRSVNAHLLATRSLLEESARDQERLRLARELHDVAGHKLTALKLNLALLQRDASVDRVHTLATAEQLASELLGDLRGVVAQLRQHDGMDLRHAIDALVAPLPRPRIDVELADDARASGAMQAETVIRVAQEALTNIVRHANATNATLRLAREGDVLVLAIADDGAGASTLVAGHGLTGMRERIEALGGTLTVVSIAGRGVSVEARIPG